MMETPPNMSPVTFKPRKLTLCSKAYCKTGHGDEWQHMPILSLSGLWMFKLGFVPGHVVHVACEHQKLIITLAEHQPWVG